MRGLRRGFRIGVAVVVGLLASGCGDRSTGEASDAGTDAVVVADAAPDARPPRAWRALILDSDLRHHSTWIDTIDALAASGLDTAYRRFYPHLTEADVTPDGDGVLPHDIVVLAAGRAPGSPGSLLRLADVDQAVGFVQDGGTLVLVTQHGHEDTYTGENDFFVLNRVMEALGVAVRVNKNTVVGTIYSDPAFPHEPKGWAYPTPLEFTLGYPYVLTDADVVLAGGTLPTLRIDSEAVHVLLRSYHVGWLWERLGGATPVATIARSRALATLAQVGTGYLAVVPRSMLTITAASTISDKPAMDPDMQGAGRAWIGGLFARLVGLLRGELAFEAIGGVELEPLFSVASPAIPALEPSGEVFTIAGEVSSLPVSAAPPAGLLVEEVPDPIPGPRPRPSWFANGGGRVAYGGWTADPTDMAVAFDEVVEHGLDALMTSTGLKTFVTADATGRAAHMVRHAIAGDLAEAAGARWFVGGWLNDGSQAYPLMAGAQGQVSDVPAPLNEAYWSQLIIPAYAAVGEVAAAHPGIAGIHLDLELYNGPVWHQDGWAFSDDTLEHYLATVTDTVWADQLRSASVQDRLDLLVDAGRLGDYFAALEERAYDLGRRCREAAHAHAPHLEMMVYVAGFPNTWFYQGFLRGLGTVAQPVIVLTYDAWALRATESLWNTGVQLVHLGGAIVGHFLPTDFDDVLVSLAQGNDGYWYFNFNDFSAINADPPDLHGPASAYWLAVDEANAVLQ